MSRGLHGSTTRIGPEFATREVFDSGRESEPKTNRLALAMGEVVQRAGWFFCFEALPLKLKVLRVDLRVNFISSSGD
jgi:hypothetical protein